MIVTYPSSAALLPIAPRIQEMDTEAERLPAPLLRVTLMFFLCLRRAALQTKFYFFPHKHVPHPLAGAYQVSEVPS